jgi:hypothetical protein
VPRHPISRPLSVISHLNQAKSKSSQAGTESSKIRPNWSKENPWISFAELSVFKGLRRPPGPKFVLASRPRYIRHQHGDRRTRPRASACGRPCARAPCSPRVVCRFHCLRFGLLRSLKASEGLAPLGSRTGGRSCVRLGGRAPHGANRGNPRPWNLGSHGAGSWGKDRAIRSDVRQRCVRSEKPEPVSSVSSERAPALHACEYLTNPCLRGLSFGFAMRGGCGRFPSGAFGRLSSSDVITTE